MNYQEYEKLVRSAFVPKILVVTTDGVEIACLKNSQKFTDLLRPYCDLADESKVIKGIREEPYELKGFRCNLVEASELQLTEKLEESSEKVLASIIRQNAPESFNMRYGKSFRVSNREEAVKFPTNRPITSLTPWFEEYQKFFLQSLGVSEHEFFGHPIACLFVVSSTHEEKDVENLTDTFVKMFDQVIKLPGLFTEGYMDSNFLRYHVLLHDNHDDIKRAEVKLAHMRKTFGGNACILQINSLPYDQPRVVHGTETFLSLDDCERLQNFVKDFVYKYAIPHIENKTQKLEEQVGASRKSLFTSKVRSFFRFQSKPRQVGEQGAPELTSTGVRIYPAGSNTAQTRQLADFAFMIRDYDSALLNYKSCIVEMKNDQSFRYWAGAIEMAAICSSLIDTQRRDSEQEMEKAYSLYLQSNSPRFANRVTMLLAALKKMRNRFPDAAAALIRADNKGNPLLGALFQEQAAFCYLYKTPTPMFRMFNMRIAMASDKFYEAGQLDHSSGCAHATQSAYHNPAWASLKSHVQFLLSRSTFLMEDLDTSCNYSMQLLTDNKQSPERQSSFFREFVHIYQYDYEKYQNIRESPVPCIVKDSVEVSLQCTYSTPEEKAWKLLEDWVVYEDAREKARSLYRPFSVPRDRIHNAFKSNVSPILEPIEVEVTLQNPLQIPVQFYSVQLLCDYYDITEELSTEGIPSDLSPLEGSFTTEKLDILLSGLETKTIKLSVTPQLIGLLEIRGIIFNLAGSVWCTKRFPIKTRKLQHTKQHRIKGAKEIDLSTSVQIVDAMPFMKVDFPRFPNFLYQGEIRQFIVTFTNTGVEALHNVAVKLSHPGLFVFGSAPVSSEMGSCPFSTTDEFVLRTESPISDQYDLSVVHLPIEQLKPGESVSIPLWTRGGKTGNQQCKFVFYYEPVIPNKFIMYRVCREEVQFGVVLSVRASFWINPSIKQPNTYTIGVQFQNNIGIQNNIGFNLLHATSISNKWEINPLSFPERTNNTDMFEMKAAESCSFFLSISAIDGTKDKSLVYRNLPLMSKYVINGGSHPFNEMLTRIRRPNPISFNTNFTHLRDVTPPPVTSLTDPTSMDMMIFWETSTSEHFGVIELCDLHFLPSLEPLSVSKRMRSTSRAGMKTHNNQRSSSALNKQQQIQLDDHNRFVRNPIRFLIRSLVKITHNFSDDSFCLVPIRVIISNPSFTDNVSFILETLKPDESAGMSKGSRANFFWAGITRHTKEDLKPREEVEIVLRAGFFGAGVYNVNKFKFLVFSSDNWEKSLEPAEPQGKLIVCSFQHLIEIEDVQQIP